MGWTSRQVESFPLPPQGSGHYDVSIERLGCSHRVTFAGVGGLSP